MQTNNQWDWEINARHSWWNINVKEWWLYRHLLARLVRRDFLLNYHQTVLGPVWMLFQPVATLVIYVLVFGKIIGVSTGGLPPVLFYLSGIILWGFFSETFNGTAFTFTHNSYLFSKVYFPRLIIPLSVLTSQFLRFLVQFVFLLLVITYYYFAWHIPLFGTFWVVFLPFIVLGVGLTAFSIGIIFSVITAKYRDLGNIVHLGVRLLMFVTPVIYPLSAIPANLRWIATLNPLLSFFEAFRYVLLGQGTFTPAQLAYSSAFTLIVFFAALSVFSRQSDKIIDVV